MSHKNSFKTFNPLKNIFNKQQYSSDTIEEIERKLEWVNEAAEILSQTPIEKISNLLKEIKSELVNNKAAICSLYCAESGLNEMRFQAEFNRTLTQLDHFSNYIMSPDWGNISDYTESTNDKIFQKKKIPIGPILVMGASNFPLAYSTIGGDSVAALAAKCPVIVKAHPYHVGTSLEVMKSIEKAILSLSFPRGTFIHIMDNSHNHARYLSTHESIKGIGFTGSLSGGESLMQYVQTRSNPIPIFAEMGSLNPIFILDCNYSEPENTFAHKLAHSVCNDRGQFCTKPGVIFIPKNTSGLRLMEQLKKEIISFKSGVMLHPNIKKNFELKISEIKNIGGSAQFFKSDKTEDFHVSNTLLIINQKEYDKQSILNTETFGPYTTIVLYDQIEQLSKHVTNLKGQLTCSIFSTELKSNKLHKEIFHLATKKAGRIVLNDVPTGVTVSRAMQHGGPYPASSDSRFTAVGSDGIYRFVRDVTIQQNII